MNFQHLLWLGIFYFVVMAASSPTKRSSLRATSEKLSRRSEKRRASTEEKRNERRSAYAPIDDEEENEKRDARVEDEEGNEAAGFKRRGNDDYGSRRTDEELDHYVLQALNELLAVEANTTEQELDDELKAKVNTVTKMADLNGFTNSTPISAEARAKLMGWKKRGVEEVEDEDDMVEKKKNFEQDGQEDRENGKYLREVRDSVVARDTFPLTGLGTLLYNTTMGLSLSKCRNMCKEDNRCDSILLILNHGLCILHQDV